MNLAPYASDDLIVVPTAGEPLTTKTTLARATAQFANGGYRDAPLPSLLNILLRTSDMPEDLLLDIARATGPAGTLALTCNRWLTESAWAQVRAATVGIGRFELYRGRVLTGPQVELVVRTSIERNRWAVGAVVWYLTGAELEHLAGQLTGHALEMVTVEQAKRAAGEPGQARPHNGNGLHLVGQPTAKSGSTAAGSEEPATDPIDVLVNDPHAGYWFRNLSAGPAVDVQLTGLLGDYSTPESKSAWARMVSLAPGFDGSVRDLVAVVTTPAAV